MSIHARLEAKLQEALHAKRLLVVNESDKHKGPPGRESHFNIICVADAFDGLALVQRHRKVNKIVQAEFDDGLHALTMKLLTPAEYEAAGGDVENPAPKCRGGH